MQARPHGSGDALPPTRASTGDHSFLRHAGAGVLVPRERGWLVATTADRFERESLEAILLARRGVGTWRRGVEDPISSALALDRRARRPGEPELTSELRTLAERGGGVTARVLDPGFGECPSLGSPERYARAVV